MLIGINGNEANVAHRVGVNQYAYELLCHLKTLARVYLSMPPRSDMPKGFDYQVLGPQKLWTLTSLQKKLLTEGLNVFFTPSHYAPLYLPCPSVISIMDLSFEKFPQYFNKKDLIQLKYWTWVSAKSAAHIITISQFSKNEITKVYGISKDKITVTYPGYDATRFKPHASLSRSRISGVLKKYKIGDKGYLLFLGTLQPKKNLERLIEAYSRLTTSWQLVVVGMINEGRGGWMNQGIFSKVKSLGLEEKVVFTGYVPDEDVPYLMGEARAFLLPSLYEGFGIPAIEAMAVGTPVVVSKVSSLPEICDRAAIYINNPEDIDDIYQALQKVQRMRAVERVNRAELGQRWVKRYNWDITAKKTLQVLYEAAQR